MNGQMLELVLVPLRAMRRTSLVWGVVLALFIGATVAFWPAFKGSSAISQAFDQMPSGLVQALGMQDIGTPAGFLRGNLYDFLVPLLLIGAAVAMASGQTAGEEDSGRLELILAQPVSRTALWVGRVVALVIALAVVVAIMLIAQLAFDAAIGLEIPASNILATVLLCALLAFLHASLAFAIAGWLRAPVPDARPRDRNRRDGVPGRGAVPAQRHPGTVAPPIAVGLGVRSRPTRRGHGCLAIPGFAGARRGARSGRRAGVQPARRPRGLNGSRADPGPRRLTRGAQEQPADPAIPA